MRSGKDNYPGSGGESNDELRSRAEEAERSSNYWHHRATHDDLTGLLNRVGLAEVLSHNRPPIGALYTDGTLKPVNDRLGHARGDQVIRDASKILELSMRATDIAARVGGDEMIVLLDVNSQTGSSSDPNERRVSDPHKHLGAVANRIQELHRNYLGHPQNADIRAAGYDLAVGGAVWQQGMTVDNLIETAEQAMYKVKNRQNQDRGYQR